MTEKHKALLDLIQFPEDVFSVSDFVPATPDSINWGVMTDSGRSATLNAMHVDDNLMVDTWHHLRPALAESVEALFINSVGPIRAGIPRLKTLGQDIDDISVECDALAWQYWDEGFAQWSQRCKMPPTARV